MATKRGHDGAGLFATTTHRTNPLRFPLLSLAGAGEGLVNENYSYTTAKSLSGR